MNRKPSDSDIRAALTKSVAAIEAPRFDLAAITARRGTVSTYTPARRARGRMAFIPVAVGLLIVAAILPTMPSVIAQVQRALHAFAVVDGKTVPLAVRTVSLEQAQAEMPFHVIPPAAVPPGLHPTINALSSDSSPATAHLIFEYHAANSDFPVLTISESADRGADRPAGLMITERVTKGSPQGMPAPNLAPPVEAGPPGAHGYAMQNVEMKVVNGHATSRRFEIHPETWVVDGTRIVLGATPGSLSPAQVAAIRAAMSR